MTGTALLSLILARGGAAALLWAPMLLWLTWLQAPVDGLRLHAATATALALVTAQALGNLFHLPVAAASPGRFRVLPSAPNRPMLVSAVGLSSLGWGAWRLTQGLDIVAIAAIFSGALSLFMAVRARHDALWGTWMELTADALRVRCPQGEDWSVPLGQVRAVHVRPRDRSFLVLTPWPERDVFVPTPEARARYRVTDHARLLEALAERAPLVDTPILVSALRRRGDRPDASA